MHGYANPNRFAKIASAILPYARWIFFISAPIGLLWALYFAPADYQQGDAYRIIFIHVPAAWMALFVYASIASASFVALVWRHPLAEIYGQAAAPVGATFTAIALVTGAIWGQPMWGTWWVWDARLTSVLILFFLYLGYMALFDAFDDEARGAKAAAILALVGVVNLPIIKFSVDWWNTLHQPATIMRLDGPAMDPSMIWPLLTMVVVFKTFMICIVLIRMQTHLTMRKVAAIRLSHQN